MQTSLSFIPVCSMHHTVLVYACLHRLSSLPALLYASRPACLFWSWWVWISLGEPRSLSNALFTIVTDVVRLLIVHLMHHYFADAASAKHILPKHQLIGPSSYQLVTVLPTFPSILSSILLSILLSTLPFFPLSTLFPLFPPLFFPYFLPPFPPSFPFLPT